MPFPDGFRGEEEAVLVDERVVVETVEMAVHCSYSRAVSQQASRPATHTCQAVLCTSQSSRAPNGHKGQLSGGWLE